MVSSRAGCRLPRREAGFTLVELMITIAVAAILVMLAAPTYVDLRERSIVRGAIGDLVGMGQRAKLEAAKRNDFVTVSVRGSAAAWCIGLQTTSVGCDCLTATCNIDQVNTTALNGAQLVAAANFTGGSVDSSGTAVTTDFTFDPKLGMLRNLGAGGTVTVRSPTSKWDYRVRFNITATGQMQLCQPTGGKHTLTDYPSC